MIDNILPLIGRSAPLLETDVKANEKTLSEIVKNSRFLVIGGAGTIGSAICKEIFNRNPKVLHVVDISENNMVELVKSSNSQGRRMAYTVSGNQDPTVEPQEIDADDAQEINILPPFGQTRKIFTRQLYNSRNTPIVWCDKNFLNFNLFYSISFILL